MPMRKDGRSATHSALVSRQVVSAQAFVTEKLLAGRVASVSASVYDVPRRDTVAVILSPGWSDVPTSTVPAGYISYQVKEVGVPRKHQPTVPACSTVALLKPSRPTHSELIVSSVVHTSLGVLHRPLTSVNVWFVADTSA